MNKYRIIVCCTFLLIVFNLLSGCKKDNHVDDIINGFVGKSVLLPQLSDKSLDYRIVIFVDTMDCVPCRLQLDKWRQLEKNINSNYDITFVTCQFYCDTLRKMIKDSKLVNANVIVDSENLLQNINRAHLYMIMNTFLLNSKNEIVLVGSPFYNDHMMNLYVKTISNRHIRNDE